MRSPTDILRQLPSSPDGGLTNAGVIRSRQLFGINRLTPLPREPIWRKFLEKFDEPIIQILLVAALLSMVVDSFKAEPFSASIALAVFFLLFAGAFIARQTRWMPSLLLVSSIVLFFVALLAGQVLVEGPAVLIAVILATGVSFASEYKSDREFEVLNARKESLQAKVLRDGAPHTIKIEDVVVGDLVLLEMGDEVSADGVVLKATELQLDQSLMTGESEPVRKQTGRQGDQETAESEGSDFLFRGTQVVDGMGRMLVTEVGDETYLGQIARRLSVDTDDVSIAGPSRSRLVQKLTIDKRLTPLQLKLKNLARSISIIGYVAAGLILLAQLVRGILAGVVYWPSDSSQASAVFGELVGYFITMVIIIVVAVPEGLPMSVTVSLALAMRKMTRAHSLVRQLVACETIGSATVICCDKTGTLTQNKMHVEFVSEGWEEGRRGEREKGRKGETLPPLPLSPSPLLPFSPSFLLVLNAAVNSTAHLEEKDGKLVTLGNSTEGALLHWLRDGGVDYKQLRSQFEPLYLLHFSSERKRMTTVIRHEGRLVALVKGAPEWILEHCQLHQSEDGTVRPFLGEMKAQVREMLQGASRRVIRTLAFAYATLPAEIEGTEESLHDACESLGKNLIYSGFMAIRDPLRDDVNEAVAQCRAAGLEIKMVTGDNVDTARAIAHEIGLIRGADLESARVFGPISNRPHEPIDLPGAAVFTSSYFNELSDDDLKRHLPGMRVLARARPLDKYRLVRLLQELGEVVAVTGDGTNDAPALKQADVGLAMGIAGTEVAKEASKIVLLDDAFSTIVRAVHWGRSLYENIQRFIQFQLTINVSALAITFLSILFLNVKAPFTVLQLLWINVIMDTLASIALCSEPPRAEVMLVPPKRRDESILSRGMVRTILSTGGFFVVVMLALLLLTKGSPSQSSLFFSIFVFFQVWNLINCRSLRADVSGLRGLQRNPIFLAVAGLVAVGQVCIVTFGGRVFGVEPLGFVEWIGVIVFTSSVLLFAEIARRVS